jgi:hypothetical protein
VAKEVYEGALAASRAQLERAREANTTPVGPRQVAPGPSQEASLGVAVGAEPTEPPQREGDSG